MSSRIRLGLKLAGGLLAMFGVLLIVGLFLPKPVRSWVYGGVDEATGGWMLVEVSTRDGGNGSPQSFVSWISPEGKRSWVGKPGSDGDSEALVVDKRTRDFLEVSIGGQRSAVRKLTLKLLARGELESVRTGFSCWGRAATLTSESVVLQWEKDAPNASVWQELADEEREKQRKALRPAKPEEGQFTFTWGDWLRSFKEDEQKADYEVSAEQEIAGLGDAWVTLRRVNYEFTGGAHGNSNTSYDSYVSEAGTAKQVSLEQLFLSGKVPWPKLMPALRRAFEDWEEGGTYLDAKDVEESLQAGSAWPHAAGLTFSYDPYAIGPYAAGAPDLVVRLSVFADEVEWNGPARLIWPKEAAKRASAKTK